MEKSYVQNESFENNLFQYIFARWDHRTTARSVQIRQTQRFRSEIRNILFELDEKKSFISHEAREKILLKLKRIGIWLFTLFIFAGAITAVYFTNQYSFQVRPQQWDWALDQYRKGSSFIWSIRKEAREKNEKQLVNKNRKKYRLGSSSWLLSIFHRSLSPWLIYFPNWSLASWKTSLCTRAQRMFDIIS